MKNTIFLPILLVICSSLLLISCNNEPKNKCKYDPPEAFFSAEDPNITSHDFQLEGMKSTESATFTNRFTLNVLQSGCESLSQEYRFEIPGQFQDQQDPAFWIELTVQSFGSLTNTGPKFSPLAQSLAQLIQSQEEYIKLGEEMPLPQMGFALTINKVVSSDFGTLLVELEELEGNQVQ